MMDLLELKKVNMSFFNNKVLSDVDFSLKSGEIHCLAGENGAGKSTIVKILTGVYTNYTGKVYIDGEDVQITSPLVSRDKGIFAVQQHRDLVPTLNAVENIFQGNYIHKKKGRNIDMKAMRESALKHFEEFQVDINLDVPVSELDVGEHGIIAICKAINANSKILIMDEASAPLDNFERKILYNILRQLREDGKGIIYITHHLEEMFEIGDRITVLRNGLNVGTFSSEEIDRTQLIGSMTGNKKLYSRSKTQTLSADMRQDKTPVIEFKDVSNKDICDVSFKAYKGEIVGFAGIDGSFKEVIAHMAYGTADVDAGEILYKGNRLKASRPINAIRQGIGLVPTDRLRFGLVPCRSISENICLPTINKTKRKVINSGWMTKLARESIYDLGIKAVSTAQLVEYLSGGNQQKVLIGKWIHAKSELLFLIEPTEGIDVGARADVYKLLKGLSESDITIVIFSSDIDELLNLSDRIYTMSQGRIFREYDANNADKRNILSDILTKQVDKG